MADLHAFENIAEFLNSEFLKRKHRNPSYSLRAFARDLNLSASRLSEVLRGKKGLSEASIDLIATQLKLKSRDRSYLKDLVLAESARNSRVKEIAQTRLETTRKTERAKPLDEEKFRLIADWHHAAIVELVQLQDFKPSPEWISARLGVPRAECKSALQLLLKLGLIKQNGESYRADAEAYNAIIERPSAAIRKFHRQVISMSIESLFQDPGQEREILSTILAIPRSELATFRQEMRQFMAAFWQRIETLPKDDLYTFGMQLCPVRNRRRTQLT